MATTEVMTKDEFIEALSKDDELAKASLSKADIERFLKAYNNTVTKALKKGKTVKFVGFGTYAVSKRAARTGRNPQDGKEIKIAARTVPKFTPGKTLKEAVN